MPEITVAILLIFMGFEYFQILCISLVHDYFIQQIKQLRKICIGILEKTLHSNATGNNKISHTYLELITRFIKMFLCVSDPARNAAKSMLRITRDEAITMSIYDVFNVDNRLLLNLVVNTAEYAIGLMEFTVL